MIKAVRQLLAQPLEIVNVEQNTPEWLKIRKTKRTASETPIVLGLSPWSSPGKLAIEKFSAVESRKPDGMAIKHGHKYEPFARAVFEEKYECIMKPAVAIRGHYMSSLDGWSKDRTEVLEIKCPFSGVYGETWEKAVDGNLPDHYYAQTQHQMMVTGAEICHFWAFNSKTYSGIRIDVEPDFDFFRKILLAWEKFMVRYA